MIICETITGATKKINKSKLVFRLAAYGVILKDNQILLVNTKSSGKWFFPGGALEVGERSIESLKRELSEETGSKVENVNFLLHKETFFYYEPLDRAYHTLNCIYTADLVDQTSHFQNPDCLDEADGFEWVDIDTLAPSDMQSFGWEVVEMVKGE